MGHISEYNRNFQFDRNIDKDVIQQISDSVKSDCIHLIIEGYNSYLIDNEKEFVVDETTITAGLYDHIENKITLTDTRCIIIPELPEFTSKIRKGKLRPKKAKKFDLCFFHFQSKPYTFLGVEAKLLVEEDYKNKNANFLVAEYVEDKGMGKYINKIYEKNGLMLGYVIKGSSEKIVKKINAKITEVYSLNDNLYYSNKYGAFDLYICLSNHNKINRELIHIFLDLGNLTEDK